MKKLAILMFLVLGSLLTYAQDSLVATHFTDNGKRIHKLKVPRYYTLNKLSVDRTEVSIVEGKKIVIVGYLKQCIVVKSETKGDLILNTRHLIVVNKNDNKDEREYFLTITYHRITKQPLRFIINPIKDKETARSYLGKII